MCVFHGRSRLRSHQMGHPIAESQRSSKQPYSSSPGSLLDLSRLSNYPNECVPTAVTSSGRRTQMGSQHKQNHRTRPPDARVVGDLWTSREQPILVDRERTGVVPHLHYMEAMIAEFAIMGHAVP